MIERVKVLAIESSRYRAIVLGGKKSLFKNKNYVIKYLKIIVKILPNKNKTCKNYQGITIDRKLYSANTCLSLIFINRNSIRNYLSERLEANKQMPYTGAFIMLISSTLQKLSSYSVRAKEKCTKNIFKIYISN